MKQPHQNSTLWSSWNIGASRFGFKLECVSTFFSFLWFGKKLNYSLLRVLSISDKQGLKRKFQVSVLGSHPFKFVPNPFRDSEGVRFLDRSKGLLRTYRSPTHGSSYICSHSPLVRLPDELIPYHIAGPENGVAMKIGRLR